MKKLVSTFLIAAVMMFPSNLFALSLEIVNESEWDVHELYFSESDEEAWGPDQLDDEVIESGSSFTLSKIPIGIYDMKIVDEDGDSCEVSEVDFDASERFVLTDEILLGCQIATAEEAEEE